MRKKRQKEKQSRRKGYFVSCRQRFVSYVAYRSIILSINAENIMLVYILYTLIESP